MEMAFSRGLHTGWFRGTNNQQLVHGRFGKKRGVYLGQVMEVRGDGVLVRLEGPLKPGDGVVFDAGRPEEKEEGGRVYEIRNPKSEIRKKSETRNPKSEIPKGRSERDVSSEFGFRTSDFFRISDLGLRTSESTLIGRAVLLSFGRGDIDFRRVHIGDRLWKTSDPELERRLRQSYEGDTPKFQRPIDIEAHGLAGKPLTLIARDELGHIARVDSAMPLVEADRRPLTIARLREQLGRLGGTPFKLGALASHLTGDVLAPVSELNRLRRELVRKLETLRAQAPRWKWGVRSPKCEVRTPGGPPGSPARTPPPSRPPSSTRSATSATPAPRPSDRP